MLTSPRSRLLWMSTTAHTVPEEGMSTAELLFSPLKIERQVDPAGFKVVHVGENWLLTPTPRCCRKIDVECDNAIDRQPNPFCGGLIVRHLHHESRDFISSQRRWIEHRASVGHIDQSFLHSIRRRRHTGRTLFTRCSVSPRHSDGKPQSDKKQASRMEPHQEMVREVLLTNKE